MIYIYRLLSVKNGKNCHAPVRIQHLSLYIYFSYVNFPKIKNQIATENLICK